MPGPRPPDPPRFIDLRIDWLAQYAPDTNLYGPEARTRAAMDLPRIEGYLGATSLAVLAIGRDSEDWAGRADRWRALDDLVARAEAEFPGRLLFGRDDLARWRDDPDGLTWGVMGVAGLSHLVRSREDLDRLPRLFARGVRLFQPGGLDLDLVPPLLDALLAIEGGGPRPSVDLAGMGVDAERAALDWFEADAGRSRRLLPIRSCGPIDDGARRLKAIGGLVGLGASSRSFESAEGLRLAIEELRDGVGLATDAFGGGRGLEGLETVPAIQSWVTTAFGADRARSLLRGAAETWIGAWIGEG